MCLRQSNINGSLYLGFPVFNTSDDKLIVDGLLISPTQSITVVLGQPTNSLKITQLEQAQNDTYVAMQNYLLKSRELRKGRNLAIPLKVLTLVGTKDEEIDNDTLLCIFIIHHR